MEGSEDADVSVSRALAEVEHLTRGMICRGIRRGGVASTGDGDAGRRGGVGRHGRSGTSGSRRC